MIQRRKDAKGINTIEAYVKIGLYMLKIRYQRERAENGFTPIVLEISM